MFIIRTKKLDLSFKMKLTREMFLIMSSKNYSMNSTKYLITEEYQDLVYLLERVKEQDLYGITLIQMAMATGARAQELLNIKDNDLNLREGFVLIHGLKSSNDREIPIQRQLVGQLQKLLKLSPDNRLFPYTYSWLQKKWKFYRPVPKKFHSLRHTFAIRLYQKSKDLRLVQVALGHRNIQNTMVYADYVYSKSELKKYIL